MRLLKLFPLFLAILLYAGCSGEDAGNQSGDTGENGTAASEVELRTRPDTVGEPGPTGIPVTVTGKQSGSAQVRFSGKNGKALLVMQGVDTVYSALSCDSTSALIPLVPGAYMVLPVFSSTPCRHPSEMSSGVVVTQQRQSANNVNAVYSAAGDTTNTSAIIIVVEDHPNKDSVEVE